MAVAITIPTVGESITEGTLVRWLKKDGDTVQVDEPIYELETEKASSEVPAPAAGKLRIKTKEGERVPIGATVGEIESDGAATKAAPARPAPTKAEEKKTAAPPPPRKDEEKTAAPRQEEKPQAPAEHVGRPFQADSVATTPPSTSKGRPTERESRQRMSPIRQRIAERLLASQQSTASLTTFNEADMSAIIDMRNRSKDKFK